MESRTSASVARFTAQTPALVRLPQKGAACATAAAAVVALAPLLGLAADRPNAATEMQLDPAKWQLVVSHDFRYGDAPQLYSKYCANFGTLSQRNTNFAPGNVYWRNGALVFKFERKRTRSCKGEWADYAGAGVSFNTALAKNIAVEAEVSGNDVRGSQAYVTTWPVAGQPHSCDWGAEDDFYEQLGRNPRKIWASTHLWSATCVHKVQQFHYDVPNYLGFNKFGVVRETIADNGDMSSTQNTGCSKFFLNGRSTGSTCSLFRPYVMKVSAGIGGPRNADIDAWRLPATFQIRKIRIWNKRQS